MAGSNAVRLVYGASFLLHLGGGALLASMEIHRAPEPTVVEVRSVERPKPKPAPPVPEPETPPEPKAPAKPAPKPAPAPAAAPPPAAAPGPAVPDFGIAMASGPGGPGGIAVPLGRPAAPVRQAAAKTLEAPKAAGGEACAEPDTKAKPITMPHPAYTEEATAAQVEGKVRVELTIDADGNVVDAKVLEGLGHGLDEAALAAVREARFTPATHCGAPVGATFTISVRFAL